MPVTHISLSALVVGVVVYSLANTGLISGAVSLSTGKPFGSVWMDHIKWTALSFAIGGCLAYVLAYFFQVVGIGIFVLLLPLFHLIHYAYKSSLTKLGISKDLAR